MCAPLCASSVYGVHPLFGLALVNISAFAYQLFSVFSFALLIFGVLYTSYMLSFTLLVGTFNASDIT